MEKLERITAVIVTFNRINFLKDLIQALRNQTVKLDSIIVVNNSSTDGTLEWLKEQSGLMVITQANSGSSGGQYTAIKTAYENGSDWVWIMDDDVLPEKDCLEKLMFNNDINIIRAPLRYSPDGKPSFNDAISYNLTNPFVSFWNLVLSQKDMDNEIIYANGITFEGPLIHRNIIDKIGYPDKKFFIYGDDTEYFIRAKKAGATIVIVRDSRLNRRLDYPDVYNGFNWKHYYIIRNIIAISVLHGNKAVRYIRPFGFLISWLRRCRNFQEIGITLKAFWHGYFFKPNIN